ncbi:MAG: glutamine amidotransferase [Burkholderiales bacterium]|nr:glutamine amidotransferase [Burkholderiales bacterium]MBH2017519.1 glutamine amidotransferase [Burkholderiales bacterium]
MSPKKTQVVAIQHLAFEDLGSFEAVLREQDMDITHLQAGVDDVSQALAQADIAVVLGGPIGVYETEAYPFLLDEIEALRQRMLARKPTLGICLGSQLMAQAFGGRVYPGGQKEIGWGELTLSDSGRRSPLQHLQGAAVLHWHGDTFELPPDAELLASSPLYANQAFRIGSNLLALQCHPEAQARTFERWLIGHAGELASARLDVPTLRAQAQRLGPTLERASQAMLREWLADLVWA